jgi:DNA adenine methylase
MTGPLAYVGGKNRLAKQIIALFPSHKVYVEAFAGGAQVFFHKQPSPVEVLNDLDGEVVNFFRVCQWHYEELLRFLRFHLVSREWFERYRSTDPATLTDIQRAARMFYLHKNSFAGLIRNPSYAYTLTRPSKLNLERVPEIIEKAHRRLQRVQIERQPYEQILVRYDRPTTLFYLDPPYWNRKLYRFNFTEADFVKLKERLEKIRGKFILSLDDRPEVRTLFHRFRFRKVEITYTVQKSANKRYPELLITNFAA